MRQIKIILSFCTLVLILLSCIKNFTPDIKNKDINKYVVSGQLNDVDDIQKVIISKTSPIGEPEFIPVDGCLVTIKDDRGNIFTTFNTGNGEYIAIINKSYMVPGVSFNVDIMTSDGINIVSDYDKISSSPDIDSVYFVRKSIPQSEPGTYRHGIQFYIDLKGDESNSRYYRWDCVETWEYHAPYPVIWYYDGSVHYVWPPDYSKTVCWREQLVNSIFTLSTRNLSENKYTKLPLHYVDNKSSKLAIGYSLLVKQYALSEEAYIYWDKLRINSSTQGGLYEKQPMAIKGNLHNMTHPDEDVLGFFSASRVTSKRIYTDPIPGLLLDFSNYCAPETLGIGGFKNILPFEYPAALVGDQEHYLPIVMNRECYDCTKLGGTTIKPDYWPK